MIGGMRRSKVTTLPSPSSNDREPAREEVAEAPSPKPASSVALRGSTPDRYVTAYVAGDGSLTTVRRSPTGARLIRKETAEYASFHRAADLPPEVRTALRDSRYVGGIRDEGEWVRVLWTDPRVRARSCSAEGWFAARGIATFEADVDPVRRWLTDGAMGVARPRRVYLDLEADSRLATTKKEAARMLAWSLYDPAAPEGQRSRYEVLAEDTDAAERKLIASLWEALEAFDQVCAWAGDFFDFPYLDARTARRGLRPERRSWLWLDHLTLYRKFNVSASDSGDEKQSLALEAVARSLGLAGKLAGVDRAKSWDEWLTDPDRLGRYCARDSEVMAEIEAATGYVDMLQAIAEAMFIFPDSRGISPSYQVEAYMMRLGRERGMRFATHHYRDEDEEDEEPFKGAYVMEPPVGVLRDVHVCDFARLYPSIIVSWNMSPETYRPELVLREPTEGRPTYLAHLPPKEIPRPAGIAEAPLTGCCFAQETPGLLPVAITEMLRLRKQWDDEKKQHAPGTVAWKDADRRSTAYKNAGNAFFGVMGLVYSRFYVRALAESITQAGVWLLQETIAAACQEGLVVVGGDTDSAFVTGCSIEQFARWVTGCNASLYPGLVAGKGVIRNLISLAYEKAFGKIVIVGKKRYAGRYSHFKGTGSCTCDVPEPKEVTGFRPGALDVKTMTCRDCGKEHKALPPGRGKPEIKGLEYKRGDAVHIARELQREVVHLLLGYRVPESDDPLDYETLVERYKARVLGGDLPLSEVVVAKKLAKPLGQYVRKRLKDGSGYMLQPQHVEVARVLQARGENVTKGRRVEYVVVDDQAKDSAARYIPASDFAGKYDPFYLWEELVFPPTQRVLEAAFPKHDWARHERVRPVKPTPRQAREAAQHKLFE